MNLLKQNKSEIKVNEIKSDELFNSYALNRDELKQIKGGTAEGGDDNSVDELIDPV